MCTGWCHRSVGSAAVPGVNDRQPVFPTMADVENIEASESNSSCLSVELRGNGKTSNSEQKMRVHTEAAAVVSKS